jgi:hypothetical protein
MLRSLAVGRDMGLVVKYHCSSDGCPPSIYYCEVGQTQVHMAKSWVEAELCQPGGLRDGPAG